jgi:predicted GIY-YIG superfamily endonuclease
MKNGTIYLLHFSEAFKHAKHYIGFTTDLPGRLAEHASGAGARLLQVITEAGLSFELARTWQGTRKTERSLKNRKEAPALCPLCNPQAMKLAKAIN